MAQFYGTIKGQSKKICTRLGSKKSGMEINLNGWNIGVKVRIWSDEQGDHFTILETGGSHNPSQQRLIATIEEQGKHHE